MQIYKHADVAVPANASLASFICCKTVSLIACYHPLCQKLLFEAKRKLGEILSAFEFLDEQSMTLVSLFLWLYMLYVLFSEKLERNSEKPCAHVFLLHEYILTKVTHLLHTLHIIPALWENAFVYDQPLVNAAY